MLTTSGSGPARSGAAPVRTSTATAREAVDRQLLRSLLALAGDPPLELVLEGSASATGDVAARGGPVARIRIRDRATLLGMLSDPAIRFPDAYAEGRVEVEGDLVAFLEAAYRSPAHRAAPGPVRVIRRWRRPHRNTPEGSRENIHRHYDIGNDFYALWLGPTMAYTCAYYPTPATTLDEAQVAKFEHVCRKLRLRPGETVVEAGCGWGGLALHMAQRHGVTVRAYNISREQVAFARERARAAGLATRVEFVEDDYRDIRGRYDAFVSVGMLEHVGVENYPELGRVIRRCLPGHGRGLIHSIGRNRPGSLHPWIEKRIFPGAQPPSPGEMAAIFETADLSVLDVENLRLHYARTLRDWKAAYEASADRVRAMFDERFVRTWRMYLAGSIAAFTSGALQLYQVLFAPAENHDLPMTREHLYHAPGDGT